MNTTTGNTVIASPSATTTYTVFSSSQYGCSQSATVTVMVNPLPNASILPSNALICVGQSIQLNATGGASYSWTPFTALNNASIANPIASPSITTVYTVYVTNSNGCSSSAITTINVHPFVPTPIIAGGFNNDCNLNVASTYSISNASPNYSYAWQITNGTPANATGTSVPISWTASGGSIFVVATDNSTGCTATATFTIEPCCGPAFSTSCVFNDNNPSTFIFVDNVTNSVSALALPPVVSNQVIVVSGTFIINQNITFDKCHFLIAPNEKIIVNSGVTLTLLNRTAMEAGCCKMWDGIYLTDQTSALIINGNAGTLFIEDAKNAIVSNLGGVYTINNCVFNNNLKGIVVNPFPGNHAGTVRNSVFSSAPSNFSGTSATLLPPFAGQKALVGIEITDVLGAIAIGSSASVPDKNIFNNLLYGISAYRSNVIIRNNEFKNITTTSLAPPPYICSFGTAVCARGFKNTTYTVTVGGPANLHKNIFTNCAIGINCFDYLNVTAENNDIDLNYTFPNLGLGIFVTNCPGNTITVKNNRIRKFNLAGISISHVTQATVNVFGNVLTNGGNNSNTARGTGIYIASVDFLVITQPTINVYNNQVLGMQTGINTINAAPVNIYNNIIGFTNALLSGTYYGIRAQNTFGTIGPNNNINKSGAIPNAALQNKVLGISAELSPGITIIENNMDKTGTGIRCFGSMPNSVLQCNHMDKTYRGVWLDNCDIGQQGSVGFPSDNTWKNNVGPYKIEGISNITSSWYYRNTSAGNYSAANFNLFPYDPPQALVAIINNGNYTCSSGTPCPNCRAAVFSQIVQEQNPFDSISIDEKFIKKQQVFRYLKKDSSIMYLNTTNDIVLQNFKTTAEPTATGKFENVRKEIGMQNYVTAITENNQATANCVQELNHKEVYAIYLNTFANDVFAFDSVQYSTLLNIASMNPYYGGLAVYDARAMLNINQDDFLSENNRYKLEEELMVSEKTPEFLLFPNPNNGKFYLQHNLQNANTDATLNIYDATGRVIKNMSLKLSDSITEIDITNITNGTYYCVICTSDGLKINAGKIVVIK